MPAAGRDAELIGENGTLIDVQQLIDGVSPKLLDNLNEQLTHYGNLNQQARSAFLNGDMSSSEYVQRRIYTQTAISEIVRLISLINNANQK